MGYVYFLKHKKMSPIKIGMTNSINLDKRIKNYNTASPYGINLIGFIKTPKPSITERTIHEELNEFRLNGEWFDINKKKANEIISKYKINFNPITLNDDFYRADDVLAEILLDIGFGDFTDEIDKRKGKRVFSINEKGRYIKFDYINIAIFNEFSCRVFYSSKISKQDLIQKLNYLTYKN